MWHLANYLQFPRYKGVTMGPTPNIYNLCSKYDFGCSASHDSLMKFPACVHLTLMSSVIKDSNGAKWDQHPKWPSAISFKCDLYAVFFLEKIAVWRIPT